MNSYKDERAAFVKVLQASGDLRSPEWAAAFRAVPRHVFVPRFFVRTDEGLWRSVDESSPDYAERVYADLTLTTQLDEAIDPDPAREPVAGAGTSSSTQPSLMAAMLEALQVEDGARVLEIGTGTGYNAALLCHRLTDKNVTTVEVDAGVADLARKRLNMCGFTPMVLAADGQLGAPTGAPYDRVIATCSVPEVPRAWIDQTADGGTILVSLWRDLGGGPLVRLSVNHGVAQGFFLATPGGFMPVRTVSPTAEALRVASKQHGQKRPSALDANLFDDPDLGLWFALFAENVMRLGLQPEEGAAQFWLFAPDGSWSVLDTQARTVEQFGPRMLWDEVEAVYELWQRFGSPNRTRLGLTVDGKGHHFWLDEPTRTVNAFDTNA